MNRFLKDILDQPSELEIVLDYSLGPEYANIERAAQELSKASRIVLTSMGSALYSLMPMYHSISKLHPCVHIAETQELLFETPFDSQTIYFIMSRSGESGEISEFAKQLKKRNRKLISITMSKSSTLAENSFLSIYDNAEYDGFICTKAYTSMALMGLLIVSEMKKEINEKLTRNLKSQFLWMEKNKLRILEKIESIEELSDINSISFLSQGAGMAVAEAGALWVSEAARIISCSSSFSGFLHGPIEQVDETFTGFWIDLGSNAKTKELFLDASKKNGFIIPVFTDKTTYPDGFVFPENGLSEVYNVLPAAMIIQMAAYKISTARGLEPGKMRYLDWIVK